MSGNARRQHSMPNTKPEKKITLKEVDEYEMPFFLAARVAKVHDLKLEYAEGLVREAKRMIYLCFVSDDEVAPSTHVDFAWHEMLMFTKFYRDFCWDLGGFIHHEPTPPESIEEYLKKSSKSKKKPNVPGDEPTYSQTKKNYEKFFGMKPDPRYWP